MKKILILTAALVAMLASCQKNEVGANQLGDEQVTLSVNLPGVATKAAGDAAQVDKLFYELYDAQSNQLAKGSTGIDAFGKATINFTLIRNAEYKVLYWAQCSQSPYDAEPSDLTKIDMKYSLNDDAPAVGNDETRDAFYGVQTFIADGTDPEAVTLTRPFAQLNFLSSDFATDLGYGESGVGNLVLEKTLVDIEVAGTTFNVSTGASNQTDGGSHIYFATYNDSTGPAYLDVDGEEGIDHLYGKAIISMNYILLANKNTETAKVNASFYYSIENEEGETFTYDDPQSFTLTGLTMMENHRTNVSGAFFVGSGTFEVGVDGEFTTPDIEKDPFEITGAVSE